MPHSLVFRSVVARLASSVSYADTFPDGGRQIGVSLLDNQGFLCTKLKFNIVTIRTNNFSMIKRGVTLSLPPSGKGDHEVVDEAKRATALRDTKERWHKERLQ